MVLDLGCGHGALSVMLGKLGAAKVIGVDLDRKRIDFANRNLAARFPELEDRVSFRAIDIAKLDSEFDLVVSKDTFEHIDDLQTVLDHVFRLLAPGGVLASGFSPLYYSPFGDHGRLGLGRMPWLHTLIPESLLFAIASRRSGQEIRSAVDVGLNKLTAPELERLLAHQRWRSVDIRCNQGSRPLFKLFDVLRRFRPIEKYFTVNIYMLATK